MKKIYMFAAAALFAACSSDNLSEKEQPQTQLEKGAVGFDVYTQKTTTRAGWAGSLSTKELKENVADPTSTQFYTKANGFGVFGYYTDNNEYEQRSVPNFMYNQQVTWNSDSWEYSPIVYWPNEYGSNATSDDQDKLTFFAYAPYVKVVPTSGKLANTAVGDDPDNTKELEAYGITSMTRNSTQGDPILKYIASFNHHKSVDLCWGVADNNDGKAWGLTQTGTAQNPDIENGTPWLNLERPANTDQRVKFTFKHATAQMQVNIDADVDVDGRGHSTLVNGKTRVWVRSVTFKGFALKGSLNLNNETANKPKWLDYGGQNELVSEDVIIYDGRKDGKEGVAGAVATNEKSLGLNPSIVQDGVYAKTSGDDVYKSTGLLVVGVDQKGAAIAEDNPNRPKYIRPGVTEKPVPLFCQNSENQNDDAGNVFHVIPTDDSFDIEIVYDIETVDGNLSQNLSDGATKGSSIENRISKEISFGSIRKLEAGHSYKLNLHLGLNSVKFDAAVVDWIDEPVQDVDLPLNVPAFAAPGPHEVTLPFKGDYTFAITGLDGGESMTNEAVSNTIMKGDGTGSATSTSTTYILGWNPSKSGGADMDNWTATKNNANTSGVAIQTVTIYPNDNTIDRTQVAKWTGAQSNKEITMTFVQAAHPLFMQITQFENNGSNGVITLTRFDDDSHSSSNHWGSVYGWICDGDGKAITYETASASNYIKVYRNGAELTWAGSATGNSFTFNNQGETDKITAKITIGDKLKSGDVIEVVLKTGDAPEETATAVVPVAVKYASATNPVMYQTTNKTFSVVPEIGAPKTTGGYESSNEDVATVDDAGTATILKVGTTTITVTDGLGNKDTQTVTINKQPLTIVGFTNPGKQSKSKAAGTVIHTFTATAKGSKDEGATGTVTYSLSVTKDGADVTSSFQMAGTNRVEPKTDVETGDYTITVTATATPSDAANYEAVVSDPVTFTYTAQ